MRKILLGIIAIIFVFNGLFNFSPGVVFAQDTPTPSGGGIVGDQNINTDQRTAIQDSINSCNILTSFSLCVLWFIYHVILGVSVWVVGIAGKIFDFFISYTLNSESYKNDFIVQGWGIIRDIANIAFIFTLLYLAIRHILGLGGVKKLLPTLIIVALLLNFSLFFTRIVIDGGNILARAFFNSITIENDKYEEEGFKSISVGVLDHINPQRLLTDLLFDPKAIPSTGAYDSGTGTVTPNSESFKSSLDNHWGYYALIFLLLAVVNFVLAGTFLSVALLFIGRTIGLWFSMIFAPIAFITLAVPGSGALVKQLSFDSWKDQTLKLAFVAPVFLFFLYLTIMFLKITSQTLVPVKDQDTFMLIMGVFIPFIFLIVLLNIAKKTANDMAGQFGSMVKSMVGKGAGFVGGVALGGAAMAGRKVVGGFASAQLKGGNYEKRIADALAVGDKTKAERLMRAQKSLIKMQDSTFDLRNAPKAKGFVGKVSGWAGSGLGAGMTSLGGKDFNVGKGGDQTRKKYEDEAEKEKLKRAEELSKIQFNERKSLEENIKTRAKGELETLPELKAKKEREMYDQIHQIVNDPNLSEEEKQTRTNNLEENLKQTFEKIEKDLKKQVEKPIEWEENRRRNLYADHVEKEQVWYNFRTEGNAPRTADRIRKGEKAKSQKDKVFEAIKEATNEGGSSTPPPSSPPPPPTPPPTGAGGTTTP